MQKYIELRIVIFLLLSSGKGLVYKSSGDCFMKTVNGEGFLGTYSFQPFTPFKTFYPYLNFNPARGKISSIFTKSCPCWKVGLLLLTCLSTGSSLQRLSALLATHGAMVSNFLAFIWTGQTVHFNCSTLKTLITYFSCFSFAILQIRRYSGATAWWFSAKNKLHFYSESGQTNNS